VHRRLATVADGARCSLASQQRDVVGSLLATFSANVVVRLRNRRSPTPAYAITPLVDVDAGVVVQDLAHLGKQPDWTFATVDSGVTPVDRVLDHRAVTGAQFVG
jgi:hypothetical protein